MKVVNIIIVFIFSIHLTHGQSSILTKDNENQLLRSSYEIYELLFDKTGQMKKPPYPVLIDTFNVCRVKNNGIENLTIYYFKSPNDSIIWREIQYNKNGLIKKMKPAIGWYMYADINPDSTYIDCSNFKEDINAKNAISKNKKLKKGNTIETFEYDTLGNLICSTRIVRGVFNRWITRTIGGGIVKYQTFYTYSNDFKTVAAKFCFFEKKKSNNCIDLEHDYVICEFDDFGNIHSELKYTQIDNKKPILLKGFKYYYSHFDIKKTSR